MSSSLSVTALDTRYRDLRLTDPAAQDAIRRRLEAGAELEPIIVWQSPDGRSVVIDGFKRVDVACGLGLSEVPVEFLAGGEAEAVAAIASLNGARRGLSQMEEAWIILRLCGEHGLSQAEVASLMGRHVSWVCRRQMLAERLVSGLQDDVRLGLLSATSAREIARLPRGNQERVAQCAARHGLSTRQVAQTCQLLLACAATDAVDEILDDPMRYLHTESTKMTEPRDPRLSEHAEAVRRAGERLDESVRRFRSTLRRFAQSPRRSDLDILLPRLHELARELGETSDMLTQFFGTHDEETDGDRPAQLAEVRSGETFAAG